MGLLLAILLDQKIRAEGVLRPIYLYPMALSFIVTGTAWKWFLDPGIGVEQVVRSWGWTRLRLRLDQEPRHGDLLRRHRRGVAVDRFRHGDVPRRPARHRQRDHQGRPDRRRLGAKLYRRIIIPQLRRRSCPRSWCSPGDQGPTTW